ncbi:MAG: response regulator, partial [Anaerolineae bacterium]
SEELVRTLRKSAPQSKKILVVDDDEGVVRLTKRCLSAAMPDMQVLAAYDGKQAIKLLDEQPDAVLLDLILPQANGLEVMRALRSRLQPKDIPVIAITAYGFEQDIASLGHGIFTVRRARHFTATEMTRWLAFVLEEMPGRYLTPAEPEPELAPMPSG